MQDGRSISGILRLLCVSRSGLIFLGFQLSPIFGSEDMFPLHVFVGIDVFVFPCLVLLSGAFLAGRFSNVLILRVALRGSENSERRN